MAAANGWTPGPWKYDTAGMCDVLSGTGAMIVSCVESSVPLEQDEPNLLLIATAPELFDALAAFVSCYEHPVSYSEFSDMLETARRVLAKARGENV